MCPGRTPDRKLNLLLSRLSGKARNMVKVSLRCHSDFFDDELFSAFVILKFNFPELPCSNLPMRDFYHTVPRAGENVVDSWICLNKAIGVADEAVYRGCHDVHCLLSWPHALSFQLKAPENWTTPEVQSCLDSHVGKVKKVVVYSQHR